ncbi:MAG TPA: hypothetical protein VIK66_14940 [Gaiellaceae bacterium]|jgi:WD40 repeat protein
MSATATELSSPYKGLAPFEDSELDALLFFGRERETEIIVSNLLASKLTVLYGPSGVGKSSVLGAAVVRRLRELEPGASVTVVDDWTGEVEVPDVDFLILDQFEEYFLYHDAGDGFAEALAVSPAHVLIALREDQLAHLDAFQADLPNVFANRLRLDHLDRSAARAAIVGPLDRWNAAVDEGARVGIETALVDEVLDQVATGPDQVEAPYLQLVLERVWDEEQESGSHVLRRSALERLGGAQAIVGAHLERALSALPPRDADIATNALRFLVTPSRTKIAHTLDDLVGYTNESPVVLQGVLERLAAQRVLRAGDGGRYEIFHDVLAEPLLAWRREREARAALAAAHRRHRRLAVLAGVSLALAAAMIALAFFAFSQRSEASKQKRVALAQRAAAIKQEHIARAQKKAADAAKQTAVVEKERADTAAARAKRNAEQSRLNAARAKRNENTARANAAAARKEKATADHNAAVAKSQKLRAERAKRFAIVQRNNATKQALIARIGRDVATAKADLTVDPALSLQAAVAASRLGPKEDAVEDALRDSLLAARIRAVFAGGGGAANSATFSHDGRFVALGAQRGLVRLYSTRTHALIHSFDAGGAATVVRFNPDDAMLAVGTARHGLLLYDVGAGKVTQTLDHGGTVLDEAFAGQYLVTGSSDQQTRVWDVASGTLLHAMAGPASAAQVAVSPDNSLVAVLSRGVAAARIYDIASGTQVGIVSPPGEVTSLAFSPNGAYLVTTGRRNGFVWDTRSWTLLNTLTGHSAAITDVSFAPDGRVITSSIDSSARVWDPATGDELFTMIGQHEQKVTAVAASPDDRTIVTASADATARLWFPPLGSVPVVLAGHTDSVTGAAFDRTSSQLLTWSTDGTARLWDAHLPQLTIIGQQAAAVTGVSYSPDGKTLLSAAGDGTAKLWHGAASVTLQHGGKVVRARFVDHGADVLTAGDDGTAKLWRASDGTLLQTYRHGGAVTVAVPVAGGVLTAGADGALKAWTTGGALRWAEQQGSPITAAAVSADGTIATGAGDGTIHLWRADGHQLAVVHAGAGSVNTLSFDHSGTLLASGGADPQTSVWNVPTAKLRYIVGGHPLGITTVAFSPDGTRFVTAGIDGDVRLWLAKNGHQLHRLGFHVSTVSQASFSPDGRWIVSAGPTAAGVWQARTGKLVYQLHGAKGQLLAATWAPDSRHIVVGDAGGGVSTFDCGVCGTTPELRAQAVAVLAGLK